MCKPTVEESERFRSPILIKSGHEKGAVVRYISFEERQLESWVEFYPFWGNKETIQLAFGTSSKPREIAV